MRLKRRHLSHIKKMLLKNIRSIYGSAISSNEGGLVEFVVDNKNKESCIIELYHTDLCAIVEFKSIDDCVLVGHELIYNSSPCSVDMNFKYWCAEQCYDGVVKEVTAYINDQYSDYISKLPNFKDDQDMFDYYREYS